MLDYVKVLDKVWCENLDVVQSLKKYLNLSVQTKTAADNMSDGNFAMICMQVLLWRNVWCALGTISLKTKPQRVLFTKVVIPV